MKKSEKWIPGVLAAKARPNIHPIKWMFARAAENINKNDVIMISMNTEQNEEIQKILEEENENSSN